jgi:hypothetical protein
MTTRPVPAVSIIPQSVTLQNVGARDAVPFNDSVAYPLCSSLFSRRPRSTVKRRKIGKAERLDITAPVMAREYNDYMGAVDQFDNLRSRYATQLTSRKWYHALFYWALDTCVINGMVVYNESKTGPEMDHRKYTEHLIDSLLNIDPKIGPLSQSGAPSPVPEHRHRTSSTDAKCKYRDCVWRPNATTGQRGCHGIDSISQRKCQHCVDCYKRGSKSPKQIANNTNAPGSCKQQCRECKVALHMECWSDFHDVNMKHTQPNND